MGVHGPLTAQALGRSPYDDVVEGEGEEDVRQPTQQYDLRGRPMNLETRRINREIVRSHNEVMLVIGVAEAENMFSTTEPESQRRHEAHEEAIGLALASPAKRCVEAVGNFGINGLRQRILIYKRYSHIPFWELFRAARGDFSLSRDVLAGAPTSFLTNYIELLVRRRQSAAKDRPIVRRCLHEVWSYARVHLELYAALQRLGLTANKLLLPSPMFFVPFTEASPIMAPPAPQDFSFPSLLRWLGGAFVSATPFIVWVMAQRLLRDWKPQIWGHIIKMLPNTIFQGKKAPPPPPGLPPPDSAQQAPAVPEPPPPPPQESAVPEPPGPSLLATAVPEPPGPAQEAPAVPEPSNEGSEGAPRHQASAGVESSPGHGTSPPQDRDPAATGGPASTGRARRHSVFSARGDEYATDEDENEGVSATLISFDVEATESADAPPGLWSAELRPSVAPDSRSSASQQPVYLDTLLTQLPALISSHIFTDTIARVLTTPYEATALRLVARHLRLRRGLPCEDIYTASMTSGLTATSAVNFFATEFLHLVLCGEVWAAFTAISQYFHRTEEEWLAVEDKARG